MGCKSKTAKLQSNYLLGGPALRLGPTSQRPPLSQLTWFNYIKPHTFTCTCTLSLFPPSLLPPSFPTPSQLYPCRQLFAPPFVLSSNAPLASTGPLIGTQTHHILFNPDEAVLFCGYCVSPDQRWLLVVCCDRQGELLDTSIIGIHHPE